MAGFEEGLSIDEVMTGYVPGNMFETVMELKHLVIEPFCPDSMKNICYYLHFNNKFREPIPGDEPIELSDKTSIESAFEKYDEMDYYILEPGKSVIAQTYEGLGVSEWFLMKLENTTQFGRAFINHASHGYLHPGHGIDKPIHLMIELIHLMIELTNLGERPVKIEPAKIEGGKVVGTTSFRAYLIKLPIKAEPYVKTGKRLQMDSSDRS